MLIPVYSPYDPEVDEVWLRIFVEGGGGYRSDDGDWTGFGQLGVAVLYEDAEEGPQ